DLEHRLGAVVAERAPDVAVAAAEDHEAEVALWAGAAALAAVGARRRVVFELRELGHRPESRAAALLEADRLEEARDVAELEPGDAVAALDLLAGVGALREVVLAAVVAPRVADPHEVEVAGRPRVRRVLAAVRAVADERERVAADHALRHRLAAARA